MLSWEVRFKDKESLPSYCINSDDAYNLCLAYICENYDQQDRDYFLSCLADSFAKNRESFMVDDVCYVTARAVIFT